MLIANINPAISGILLHGSFGHNRYTDWGIDAGYQFLGDGTHIGTAYVLFVRENQDLPASLNQGDFEPGRAVP